METRANHVWVGVVTLVLLAALALFIVWLARLNKGDAERIRHLLQAVGRGACQGSRSQLRGRAFGAGQRHRAVGEGPRVRPRADQGARNDVPVLVGTTATIQGSFTGVSTILLDGARRGAPPFTCEGDGLGKTACPEGGR